MTSGYTAVNLAAALALGDAGIPVFPALVSWNEAAGKLDKRPAIAGWQSNASTQRQSIENFWRQFPDAIPAIELGRAGLLVVDLDRHPGAPDGMRAFRNILQERITPTPPLTDTPSQGLHLFFRQPAGEPFGNGRGELPAGIDIRGRAGFVIAPGAVSSYGAWRGHPNTALAGAFQNGNIPMLPAWLAEIIRPPITIIEQPPFDAKAINKGGRREEAWAAAALEGLTAELAATPRGMRNHALNATAYRLGKISARGWLDQAQVKHALFKCAQANGLVHDDGRRAAWATILSGFNDGLLEPHADLPPPLIRSSSGRSQ